MASFIDWFTSGESPIGLVAIGCAIGFAAGSLFAFVRNPEARKLKADLAESTERRKKAEAENEQIKPKLENLNKLRAALDSDEDELWRLHASDAPVDVRDRLTKNKPKIITVMNLKGGVGKTTTVANLAAHFGSTGKRVLTIDLDYQGSLSRMLLLAASAKGGSEPRAIDFLEGKLEAEHLQRTVISLQGKIPNVDLVSCGQKFDRFENRLMLRWLIGDEPDDIRHRLATVLTSDVFIENYDIVLIDAPPRLSTGAINALATSHVLLIPTVLDRLSAEAIGNFISRVNVFRQMNASLQYAGAIGTLRGQLGGADVSEGAREIALEGLASWTGTSHLFDSDIKYFTELARQAGSNVGYLKNADVREAYTLLASELERELRL